DLHAHVPEPAQAQHGDLLGPAVDLLAVAPSAQRGVGGDARAQQRSGLVEGDLVGNAQHEPLVDHDLLGVAALSDGAVDVRRVVRADVPLEAVLLLAGAALQAGAAGVDHAAHAHPVADLPVGDVRADGGDAAGDLVAEGAREVRLAPLVADGVDVAVADPGGGDVDDHVAGPRVAALDGGDAERLIGARLLQGLDGDRHGGTSGRSWGGDGERAACQPIRAQAKWSKPVPSTTAPSSSTAGPSGAGSKTLPMGRKPSGTPPGAKAASIACSSPPCSTQDHGSASSSCARAARCSTSGVSAAPSRSRVTCEAAARRRPSRISPSERSIMARALRPTVQPRERSGSGASCQRTSSAAEKSRMPRSMTVGLPSVPGVTSARSPSTRARPAAERPSRVEPIARTSPGRAPERRTGSCSRGRAPIAVTVTVSRSARPRSPPTMLAP